jgi:putative membrane protein
MRTHRSRLAWLICLGAVAALPASCSDDNNNIVRLDGSAGIADGGGTGGFSGADGSAGADGGGARDGSVQDGNLADGAGDGALDGAQDGSTMPLSDPAAAVGVMLEANNGEIAAGAQALARAQASAVRDFAMMMISDHTDANQRLAMLAQNLGIMPVDSPQRRTLAMMAQAALDQLWQTSGAAFDMAYVQSQVVMHQQVLQLLDNVLIPGAQNMQLKTELMAARMTVAMHLAAAQALLARDGGAGADGASDAAVDGGSVDGGGDSGADSAATDASTD